MYACPVVVMRGARFWRVIFTDVQEGCASAEFGTTSGGGGGGDTSAKLDVSPVPVRVIRECFP